MFIDNQDAEWSKADARAKILIYTSENKLLAAPKDLVGKITKPGPPLI